MWLHTASSNPMTRAWPPGNAASAGDPPGSHCHLHHVQCAPGQVSTLSVGMRAQTPCCHVSMHRSHSGNVLLLRGAVFYISMSLWGVKRVDTLGLPFTAVLPAVQQVHDCMWSHASCRRVQLTLTSHQQAALSGHTIVVYEVALSVLRLVRYYSSHLDQREWEVVHRILHATQHHLTQAQQVGREGRGSVVLGVGSCLRCGSCSLSGPARLTPSRPAAGNAAGHLL